MLEAIDLSKYYNGTAALDEPTSGLDPQASNEFSASLKKLSEGGVAVLMATHDLFRAKESGTRVGIMKRGRLVNQLRTEEIGHADLEQMIDNLHFSRYRALPLTVKRRFARGIDFTVAYSLAEAKDDNSRDSFTTFPTFLNSGAKKTGRCPIKRFAPEHVR